MLCCVFIFTTARAVSFQSSMLFNVFNVSITKFYHFNTAKMRIKAHHLYGNKIAMHGVARIN